jgi:hypothetical protein
MIPSLTTVLLAALGAPALEHPNATSPPPTLHSVTRVAADRGEIQYQVTMTVPVTEKRTVAETVNQNGKQVVVNREVTVTMMRQEAKEVLWSAKAGRAIDGSGKPVAADELFKRLKAGDTILHAPGDKVDPAWLKVLKPDAVILLTAPPAPPKQ